MTYRHDVARMRRSADTDAERAALAPAEALLVERQAENVEELVGVLDEADGRAERRIAAFALQDARGRDKAISVIFGHIEAGVLAKAVEGPTRALASLSGDRDERYAAPHARRRPRPRPASRPAQRRAGADDARQPPGLGHAGRLDAERKR